MNKSIICLGAALVAGFVFADDAAEATDTAEALPAAATTKKPEASVFSTLPFCSRAVGEAQVKKPGAADYVAIEEGKFYPLGSSYRTGKGGELVLAFGRECTATIGEGTWFSTRLQGLGIASRTIVLGNGKVSLKLANNMPAGAFVVTSPAFLVKDPAGESTYDYKDLGDGFEATVRCVTGAMKVEGHHFRIPTMHAANEFRIRADRDNLETILYGTSGDYILEVDRGIVAKTEVDDSGEVTQKSEEGKLEWHLSPQTRVQINRAVPSIGEKMSVAVLAFDPAGNLKHHFAFAEGRAEVNSGELVEAEKSDAAAVAKKAAEATTEEVAAEDDEEEASDKKENNENNEENNEEKEEE